MHKQDVVVLKTELAWSRSGVVLVTISCCEACHAKAVSCLVTDTSDEEYGTTSLCLPCIQAGFTKYEAGHDQNQDHRDNRGLCAQGPPVAACSAAGVPALRACPDHQEPALAAPTAQIPLGS